MMHDSYHLIHSAILIQEGGILLSSPNSHPKRYSIKTRAVRTVHGATDCIIRSQRVFLFESGCGDLYYNASSSLWVRHLGDELLGAVDCKTAFCHSTSCTTDRDDCARFSQHGECDIQITPQAVIKARVPTSGDPAKDQPLRSTYSGMGECLDQQPSAEPVSDSETSSEHLLGAYRDRLDLSGHDKPSRTAAHRVLDTVRDHFLIW